MAWHANREEVFVLMRRIGEKVDLEWQQAKRLGPRSGEFAIGSADFDHTLKGTIGEEYLRTLQRGGTPIEAFNAAIEAGKDSIKKWNERGCNSRHIVAGRYELHRNECSAEAHALGFHQPFVKFIEPERVEMGVQERGYMELPLEDPPEHELPELPKPKAKRGKKTVDAQTKYPAVNSLLIVADLFQKELETRESIEADLRTKIGTLEAKCKTLLEANATRPEIRPVVETLCYMLQTLTKIRPVDESDRQQLVHCAENGHKLLSTLLTNQEDAVHYPAARLASETALRQFYAFCDQHKLSVGFDPVALGC